MKIVRLDWNSHTVDFDNFEYTAFDNWEHDEIAIEVFLKGFCAVKSGGIHLQTYDVTPFCGNCQGENAKTGYVENWDGKCPDCGNTIKEVQ